MTDLTKRLIAMRDSPGLTDALYFLDPHSRRILTEAVNRIEELEAAAEKWERRKRGADYRREEAEAERDRYQEALGALSVAIQGALRTGELGPLDATADRIFAALNPEADDE